jgi:hypothetical protein
LDPMLLFSDLAYEISSPTYRKLPWQTLDSVKPISVVYTVNWEGIKF